MNRGDFVKLRNFSYEEILDTYLRKGYSSVEAEFEINKVDLRLMEMLQRVRERINSSIIINSLTDGGHVAGSYHYQGKAVDWHFGDANLHPNRILQVCLTIGFLGIGWYPEWRWPGFHCDIGARTGVQLWQKKNDSYKPIIEKP